MALQAVLLSAFATAGGLVSGASWYQRSGAGMRFTRKVRFQTRNPWCYQAYQAVPIGSMYGIFTYIYHKHQLNVGKYTIHGWYGVGKNHPPGSLLELQIQAFLLNS